MTDELEVQNKEFENDVLEYKEMEQKVTQDFLSGIIKLGEILCRQRAKWKEKNEWTNYVQSIGRTLFHINQFIRIYEYSLKNLNNLLQANVTNWGKLNTFLTLPDHLKDKLAEEIDGVDVTSDEFREKVTEIKSEEDGEINTIAEDALSEIPIPNDSLAELIQGSSLADVRFMAKKLIDELNKGGYSFSNTSLPLAEAFLSLESSLRDAKTENFEKLSPEEKEFWQDLLLKQVKRLSISLKQ